MVCDSAPIAMWQQQLGEQAWAEKRAIMLAYLQEKLVDLPVSLNSRAWIGTGCKSLVC